MPYFTSACVCPPHTSITTHGRVTSCAIALRRPCATPASRYSSTNFIEPTQFGEERERALGLLFVDALERETDMHEHVVARDHAAYVVQTDLLGDAAEIDATDEHAFMLGYIDHTGRDRETHVRCWPPNLAPRRRRADRAQGHRRSAVPARGEWCRARALRGEPRAPG